jgi:hypothetical protein
MKFGEFWPLVSVGAVNFTTVNRFLHCANFSPGCDAVLHFISQEFGANNFFIERYIVCHEVVCLPDMVIELLQNRCNSVPFLVCHVSRYAMNPRCINGNSKPVWFDDEVACRNFVSVIVI